MLAFVDADADASENEGSVSSRLEAVTLVEAELRRRTPSVRLLAGSDNSDRLVAKSNEGAPKLPCAENESVGPTGAALGTVVPKLNPAPPKPALLPLAITVAWVRLPPEVGTRANP